MCAFVWCANAIPKGEEVQKHQDAVINEIFGYDDKKEFLKNERRATEVSTWDGRHRALISHEALKDMAEMVGILGPSAGVYGRDIEQLLMGYDRPTLIPENKFNESVKLGRHTLRLEALSSYQDQSMGSNYSDSDVRSRLSSRRELSPRRESRR